MKTTGIIGITFKAGVPENVVKRTIENIYSLNKVVIEGMTYCEFKNETEPNDSTLEDFVEAV